MTAPAVACRDEAFFEEAAESLAERDISGVPVVDRDGLVASPLPADVLASGKPAPRRKRDKRPGGNDSEGGIDQGGAERAGPSAHRARRAREVMTTPALTISPDTALEEIARLMRLHQVNRLPVVGSDPIQLPAARSICSTGAARTGEAIEFVNGGRGTDR
ncbi:MAG: CBS domain-containing protein [Actinomycetota bacterium]